MENQNPNVHYFNHSGMINCDTCHSKQQRSHRSALSSIVVLGFEEDTTMEKKLVHYDGELRHFLTLAGNSTRLIENKVYDLYWQCYFVQKLLMSPIPGT